MIRPLSLTDIEQLYAERGVAPVVLQGGAYGAEEAAAFERHAYWHDAVALRRFDDKGEQDEFSVRSLRGVPASIARASTVTPLAVSRGAQ